MSHLEDNLASEISWAIWAKHTKTIQTENTRTHTVVKNWENKGETIAVSCLVFIICCKYYLGLGYFKNSSFS